MTTDTLMSPQELAGYLGVPVSTVYRWNYVGTGPKVLHVGKHVRYRRADVAAWLERNERGSGDAA